MPAENRHIFSIGQRLQHLLLVLAFGGSLVTALALPSGGGGPRTPWAAAAAGWDVAHWHAAFGLAALATVLGHLVYLATRGYIENISWRAFPLRWSREDTRRMRAEVSALTGGRGLEDVRYSPMRKLVYWSFLAGLPAAAASGAAVRLWDVLDSPLVSANLGFLASFHAGTAYVLAVLGLWHVYGLAGGGRKMSLLKLAVTGRIGLDDFRRFYPDEHRRLMEMEEKAAEELLRADHVKALENAGEEEKRRIEDLLAAGNRLAKEGSYAAAAEKYRMALKEFPAYSQAQYNLALVLRKAGRRDEALEAFRRFMDIDPFHPLGERAREAIRELQGGES